MNQTSNNDSPTAMGVDNIEFIESNVTEALVLKRGDLIKKLEALESSVNQVDEEYKAKINELQAKKKPWEEALFHIEALLKLNGRNSNGDLAIKEKESTSTALENISITDAAFNILQQEHKPLHYKEITRLLQENNIYIPGKNPSATLLSRINRNKRFKRDKKRGVYILSGWRVSSSKSDKRRKSGKHHRQLRGRK